jgi:RNA recognition motif-containing protein
MPIDPVSKKSKGLAYIDFDSEEAATRAIKEVSNLVNTL